MRALNDLFLPFPPPSARGGGGGGEKGEREREREEKKKIFFFFFSEPTNSGESRESGAFLKDVQRRSFFCYFFAKGN